MKISVITRHGITNYGSILQAYATQRIFEKLGHRAEIIDYIRNDEYYKNIAKILLKKNPKWNKNFVTRGLYMILQSPGYILSGRRFEKMRKEILHMSAKYSSLNELENNVPAADAYCTGSDQVWGPIGGEQFDSAYFLSFVDDKKYKFSYAGSFGKTNFDNNIKSVYSRLLSKYDKITVRENSAVGIVEELTGKAPDQVLDPTLLLNSDEWSEFIEKDINKKYVLIYQLHSNKQMNNYAKEFAKKVNLPLIRITPALHHIVRSGKTVLLPNLGEFLSYIKNAEYMITDSFHGTAFAINFGTQFIDILPGETKTRNQSVLQLTNLTDRVLSDYNDFSFIDKKIDYAPVREIINKERERSINILKEML